MVLRAMIIELEKGSRGTDSSQKAPGSTEALPDTGNNECSRPGMVKDEQPLLHIAAHEINRPAFPIVLCSPRFLVAFMGLFGLNSIGCGFDGVLAPYINDEFDLNAIHAAPPDDCSSNVPRSYIWCPNQSIRHEVAYSWWLVDRCSESHPLETDCVWRKFAIREACNIALLCGCSFGSSNAAAAGQDLEGDRSDRGSEPGCLWAIRSILSGVWANEYCNRRWWLGRTALRCVRSCVVGLGSDVSVNGSLELNHACLRNFLGERQ